jgi:hypothetical protein
MVLGMKDEQEGTDHCFCQTWYHRKTQVHNQARNTMSTILFVRVKSDLEPQELERRLLERKPSFYKIPGLIQKIYGRDESTGDVCGIYFFENREALEAFRETELAMTIPTAYEATDIRREVYEVIYPLYPDKGPVPE